MKKASFFLVFIILVSYNSVKAQVDSVQYKKTYTSYSEAIKDPLKVYRLNLSNLPQDSLPINFSKFKNLCYLCLNNDHLKVIPNSLGDLENLQILELSGEDFKILPQEMSNLKKLEEVYLNFDQNMDISNTVNTLSTLPKLKILHLESDGLGQLPQNFGKLKSLEKLYLNDNNLMEVPKELQGLKKLKYVDMQNNKIPKPLQVQPNYKTFGFRVNF